MLSNVLSVVKSKAALAVLGVALVGGGATAAYAATGHQLPVTGTHADATAKPDTSHDAGKNHGHTVSIEGVLKSYSGGKINVQTKDGKSTTVVVNGNTRIEGDRASTLSALSKNIGHKVEVQADKQSNDTLVAWKVTVEGATGDASSHGNSNGNGNNGDSNKGQGHALRARPTLSA